MQVYAEENDISIIKKLKAALQIFMIFNFDLWEKTCFGHVFIWIILPTKSKKGVGPKKKELDKKND